MNISKELKIPVLDNLDSLTDNELLGYKIIWEKYITGDDADPRQNGKVKLSKINEEIKRRTYEN